MPKVGTTCAVVLDTPTPGMTFCIVYTGSCSVIPSTVIMYWEPRIRPVILFVYFRPPQKSRYYVCTRSPYRAPGFDCRSRCGGSCSERSTLCRGQLGTPWQCCRRLLGVLVASPGQRLHVASWKASGLSFSAIYFQWSMGYFRI